MKTTFSTLYTLFSQASSQTSGNPSRLKQSTTHQLVYQTPIVSFQTSSPTPKPNHKPYYKIKNQRHLQELWSLKHLKHMISSELSTQPTPKKHDFRTPHPNHQKHCFYPPHCLHTLQISKEHLQIREHTSPTWHCS